MLSDPHSRPPIRSLAARNLRRGPRVQLWEALAAILLSWITFTPSSALACGASAAGPGVSACSIDLDAYQQSSRKSRVRLGLGYGVTRTRLKFSGPSSNGTQVLDQRRVALLALVEWRPHWRWGISAGLGSLVHGALWSTRSAYSLRPGFTASLGANFVAHRADGPIPFVLLSAQLSGVISSTNDHSGYQAVDLRLGAQLGWTVFDVLSPYFVTRLFGGPIFWTLEGADVR